MTRRRRRVRAALVDGNRAYEERFGHVFLIRAAGRTPEEMLAELTPPAGQRRRRRAGRGDRAAGADHRAAGEGTGARMSVSTHVLDAAAGRPAAGIAGPAVRPGRSLLAEGHHRRRRPLPADRGRRPAGHAPAGLRHRRWFAEQGRETFYPEVVLTFAVREPAAHHHVPLLLARSPTRPTAAATERRFHVQHREVRHGDRARAQPVRQGRGPRRRGRPRHAPAHARSTSTSAPACAATSPPRTPPATTPTC